MASRSDRPGQRWRVLFLLFFLSGISGLIYESIWSRYIRLFVGSAATAQILVLSLFMGGMSLGALLAGRYIRRLRSPIIAYGVIEGCIGLYALAFPYIQAGAMRLSYDVLFPALGGGSAVVVAKWLVAALLILPPCVMLGTTFPLMSVGILRRDLARSGEVLSLLYFTNSLGASMGALLSGFVLVGALGLPGTLMVGAAINIFIMVIALRDRDPAPPIEERQTGTGPGDNVRGAMVWLFLAVAFGTGLSSFMYEIGWIRLLSMVLGSATHSFEVMLSAFILGLAMGGLFIRKRMDRFKRPEVVLAIVQFAMGLAAIATLPLYEQAVSAMGWLMDYDAGTREILGFELSLARTDSLWRVFNVVRYLLCLLIMFPATFCAGMTLPLLTHVMLKRGQPEAVVGNVYGVNTLGAISGAVAAGLLLMPVVGIKGVIVLGALFDMILGLLLIRHEIRVGRATARLRTFLMTASGGTVLAVLVGLAVVRVDPMVLTSTVFRHGRQSLPEQYEILSYVDGRTASVTVVDNTSHPSYHIIYTNGKPDASVILDRWPEDRDPDIGPDIAGDEPNQFLVGIVPLMAKPEATHAALIGFGSGVTCHTVLGSPNLVKLDTVEIEPEMVEGSRFFMPVNYRAYKDPRSNIVFDDAKAYFASAGIQYDFIISEPTNPWVSGVSSLFTVEFYQEVKRYLKPGGVLGQWLQGYELSDELMMSVLAAIDREFEDYLVVRIGTLDWVILSSPDGPVPELSADVLAWPGLQESFELLGIHDVGQIDGLVIANKKLLHPFISQRQANRDMVPLLDTGAEKQRFLRVSAEFLHEMRWSPAPILPVLAGIEPRPYPLEGIGDRRDPHILLEAEEAVLLMRAFEDGGVALPDGLSGVAMPQWRQQEALGPVDWSAWLAATYTIYEQIVPHLDVAATPWWAQVMRTASTDGIPAPVRSSIAILDAMARRDGATLWAALEPTLDDVNHPLPLSMRTLAGLVALELRGATPEERRTFVSEHMSGLGNEGQSSDFGYQVLRAYGAR
ncbi:MAG: spermidine synthase [Deltaproteobacteria bacterium]|nr:spermidine synthase [Deltaproteobacteria bacterium]